MCPRGGGSERDRVESLNRCTRILSYSKNFFPIKLSGTDPITNTCSHPNLMGDGRPLSEVLQYCDIVMRIGIGRFKIPEANNWMQVRPNIVSCVLIRLGIKGHVCKP